MAAPLPDVCVPVHWYDEEACDSPPPCEDGEPCGHGFKVIMIWVAGDDERVPPTEEDEPVPEVPC